MRLIALAVLVCPLLVLAQEENTPLQSAEPKHRFFAGRVTELQADRIVVSRSLSGREPEHRSFVIRPETKMSKNVKIRVKVTVRYKTFEGSDVALEIVVRTPPRSHQPFH